MSHLSSEALREFRLPDMPGQRTVRDLSSHCLAIKALQLFSFGYETLNLARFMKYSLFFSLSARQDVRSEVGFILWRTRGTQIWGSPSASCTASSASANP